MCRVVQRRSGKRLPCFGQRPRLSVRPALPCRWALQLSGSLRLLSVNDTLGSCVVELMLGGMGWDGMGWDGMGWSGRSVGGVPRMGLSNGPERAGC